MIITIDGPAASGKSSVAKKLCTKLNIYYLYTGLLYRAVAYVFCNILEKDILDIESLDAKDLDFIKKISYEYQNNEPYVFYDGKNITDKLHNIALSRQASVLSSKKEIRQSLMQLQRSVADRYDIVADGRDCGSVVFPNADHKFFLTADVDVRAKRIFGDKGRNNAGISLQEVKVELETRDARDMQRKVAPLVIPKDGIVIDNSEIGEDETVEKFLEYIEKGPKR